MEKDFSRAGRFALWRRVFLLLGISLFLLTFFYASTAPMVHMKAVDISFLQKLELSNEVVTERNRYLADLPPGEYLKILADGSLLVWEGDKTELDLVAQGSTPPGWEQRVFERDGLVQPGFYFRATEEPVATLLKNWENRSQKLYVPLNSLEDDPVRVVSLLYEPFPLETISFGGSARFHPPVSMIHTTRGISWIFLLLGFLLYLILPRDRDRDSGLVMPLWKTRMNDFAIVLLFTTFFGMPLLITGSVGNALREGILLTIPLWGMSLFAVCLAVVNAWYESFSLHLEDDGVQMVSYRGQVDLFWRDIRGVGYVEKRMKPIFRLLMWLVFLFSRGSTSLVMGSQLTFTRGAMAQGLRFTKNTGETVDLWLLDGGAQALIGQHEKLISSLEGAGISFNQEPALETSIGSIGGKRLWPRKKMVIPLLCGTIIVALTLSIQILLMLGESTRTVSFTGTPSQSDESFVLPGPDESIVLGNLTVDVLVPTWTTLWGEEGVERTDALSSGPEDTFYAAGMTSSGGIRAAGLVLHVDAQGRVLEEVILSMTGREVFLADIVATANGAVVTGTAGTYLGRNGFLTGISSGGDISWHQDLEGESSSSGGALTVNTDNNLVWAGHLDSESFIRLLTPDGLELDVFGVGEGDRQGAVSSLVPAPKGIWAVGSIPDSSGEFTDPMVALFGEDGKLEFFWNEGGPRDDILLGSVSCPAGLFATGASRIQEHWDRHLIYLLMGEEGVIWQKNFRAPDHHLTGVAAAVLPQGDFLMLVQVGNDHMSHYFTFLLRTDPHGEPISAHRLYLDGSVRGTALLVAADGSVVVGGTTGPLPDRGSASMVLMGVSAADLTP